MKSTHRLITTFILASLIACEAPTARALQTIKSFESAGNTNLADADKPTIRVFADGSVLGYTRGDSVGTRPATGSLGFEILKPKQKQRWSASISVASSADTVEAGFGPRLLNVGGGAAIRSGLVDLQQEFTDSKFWKGPLTQKLHLYVSVSGGVWRDSNRVFNASVIGLGASRYTQVAKGQLASTPVYFTLEGGVALRLLAGDIGGKENRQVRSRLLGTSGRGFLGPDLGMQLGFGDVTLDLHYLQLFDVDKKAKVEGLTTGQIVGGISIRGSILMGMLEGD